MSGASARSPAALDCVYDKCRVHADVHPDGKAPAEVLVGADGHGKFFVQLLHVVAVARQVTVDGAQKWVQRRVNAQQGSNEWTRPERKWASSRNMNVRSCLVSEVQNVMEHAASHGNLDQRGRIGQPLNSDQIRLVCERIRLHIEFRSKFDSKSNDSIFSFAITG